VPLCMSRIGVLRRGEGGVAGVLGSDTGKVDKKDGGSWSLKVMRLSSFVVCRWMVDGRVMFMSMSWYHYRSVHVVLPISCGRCRGVVVLITCMSNPRTFPTLACCHGLGRSADIATYLPSTYPRLNKMACLQSTVPEHRELER
jgi:hypothetical protein